MNSLIAIWIALMIGLSSSSGGYSQEVIEEVEEISTVAEEKPAFSSIRRREITATAPKRVYDEDEIIFLEVEDKPVEETTEAPSEPEEKYFPLFMVDGEMLDESVQELLWDELSVYGLGWWMPYAMLQMYQESQFNPYDITNGLDYGILQYRKMYWADKAARYGLPGADIFDVSAQIHVYVQETKKRLIDYGLDIYETVSRHMTSDYGSYNSKYVDDVFSHSIQQIR